MIDIGKYEIEQISTTHVLIVNTETEESGEFSIDKFEQVVQAFFYEEL